MSKIRIVCEGASMVPLSELEEFQGELKSLDDRHYMKLRRSIVEEGFHTAIDVWKKPGEKKPRKMLDGHQRVRTLNRMIESEGFTLENNKVPVDWVIAKTEKQANKMLLQKTSAYGKVSNESLYEYIETRGLEWDTLKRSIDIPQINMGSFEVGFMRDEEIKEPKGKGGKPLVCPNCGEPLDG